MQIMTMEHAIRVLNSLRPSNRPSNDLKSTDEEIERAITYAVTAIYEYDIYAKISYATDEGIFCKDVDCDECPFYQKVNVNYNCKIKNYIMGNDECLKLR